jgi:hypothetical protein
MQVKGRLEKLTKVSVNAPYSAADLPSAAGAATTLVCRASKADDGSDLRQTRVLRALSAASATAVDLTDLDMLSLACLALAAAVLVARLSNIH